MDSVLILIIFFLSARPILTASSVFRSVVADLCDGPAATPDTAGPAFLLVRKSLSFYPNSIASESFYPVIQRPRTDLQHR